MIVAQTTIRRARRLPVPGEITAFVGQRVEPPDVIGRASLPGGEYRVLPVARLLGVPDEHLTEVCLYRAGESVREGDVLARQPGLLRPRAVRAPADGVIVALSEGCLILEVAPRVVEVRAGMRGTVVGILEGGLAAAGLGQGVMIELTGALIQGAWGSGQGAYGLLRIVAGPDRLLEPGDIDVSCHGVIIVAGASLSEAALRQAQQMQVRGLILGSLPADLCEAVIDLPFPVMAVEGMGHRPMATATFELLKTHDGREATLIADMPGRWQPGRPEVIIPIPVVDAQPAALPLAKGKVIGEQPAPPLALEPGARVRALRAPYAGAIGTVKKLYDRPRPLPTGSRLPGAEVDFGPTTAGAAASETAFIPYANLERVE
ncbi:MAG: hypothetical protein C4311_05365 [Chloroflexota bacterium]